MLNDLISIIVLTHNSKDHIQNCVTSIFEQNYDNFELIIVDNYSNDETIDILKSLESEYSKKVKIILNSSNLGYNLGNKIGFDSTHGNYVVIINPDIILDTFWLSNIMIYFHQNPKFELVCGILKNKKNEIISTGGLMDIYGAVRQRKDTEQDLEFFYPQGSAFVFRKSLLDKLTLDPNLFMYYDDVDFAWQLRLLNLKIGFCKESFAIHDEGHSNSEMTLSKFFLISKNRIYVCRKNYSSKILFKRLYKILFLVFLDSIYYSYKNKSVSYFFTFFKSLFWNVSRGKSLRIQRKILQKNRLVNDAEIEKFMMKNSIERETFTSSNSIIMWD